MSAPFERGSEVMMERLTTSNLATVAMHQRSSQGGQSGCAKVYASIEETPLSSSKKSNLLSNEDSGASEQKLVIDSPHVHSQLDKRENIKEQNGMAIGRKEEIARLENKSQFPLSTRVNAEPFGSLPEGTHQVNNKHDAPIKQEKLDGKNKEEQAYSPHSNGSKIASSGHGVVPSPPIHPLDTVCNKDSPQSTSLVPPSKKLRVEHASVLGDPLPSTERKLYPVIDLTDSVEEMNSDQGDESEQELRRISDGECSKQSEQSNSSYRLKSTPDRDREDAVETGLTMMSTADSADLCDPAVTSFIKLEATPEGAPLLQLSDHENSVLEELLQIKVDGKGDDCWKDDWSGNLHLFEKEITVLASSPSQQPNTKTELTHFHEYDADNSTSPDDFRGTRLLFRHVCHMKGTPSMAKRILSYSLSRKADTAEERYDFILDGYRRVWYDPLVLLQDGWITKKSVSPDGASGGAHLIGEKVLWQKVEAVVIAFVRDDDIGDLWKALWVEDMETFDLEADELQEAMKKWRARAAKRKNDAKTSATRYSGFADFTIEGSECGIVLARSSHSNARHGIFWPARILNVTEIKTSEPKPTTKRSVAQKHISVVFLAPYWNGRSVCGARKKGAVESSAVFGTESTNIFNLGALFEIESVESSDSVIKKYPYGDSDVISIDKITSEFRFLGLPKAAFPRFLHSHRLAAALHRYARRNLCKPDSTNTSAFSSLVDCHALSMTAPQFPTALLHLPYDFILSNIERTCDGQSVLLRDVTEESTEPVINLERMLNAMMPPECFASGTNNGGLTQKDDRRCPPATLLLSPGAKANVSFASQISASLPPISVDDVLSEYISTALGIGTQDVVPDRLLTLRCHISELISQLNELRSAKGVEIRESREKLILNMCISVKSLGEDLLSTKGFLAQDIDCATLVSEWRKACERIYRHALRVKTTNGRGHGVVVVSSDVRCNEHLTASGSFERAVRLPAAIRGAKMAGAGKDPNIVLAAQVKDKYLNLAENVVLSKAHKLSYLKRIKSKVAALPIDARGAPLTDDSDGEGGEDTRGSRGSYTAALTAVAVALQGVDMVLDGNCISTFCAVRPPGHHAGRELHAMSAVSNGFCVLNAAACAALYAVTPRCEGGRGLKRVCVIDFDVHHGNGTQDILGSTYDSRFLYVSLHAGGSHINGLEESETESTYGEVFEFRRSLGASRQDGIFPGRCGDTSPHPGVLNVPLGQKVTAHAVGAALIREINPAVLKFAPDLIVLSAGFDAHKNDPLGMGGLSADDFGSITEVACQIAMKVCSGRIVSVLEGGYGVPCCRPIGNLFLPADTQGACAGRSTDTVTQYLDLKGDMPDNMEDSVPRDMRQMLDKCHSEGFVDCVKCHVEALSNNSKFGA